jgi:hypothetical protein
MSEVVAIIEWRIVVVVDVLRQNVLAFFRDDLQKHLANA